MSSHQDHDLDRALRRQVEHLDGAPLTLEDVRSRAGRIQRRRRIAASVAAAAAVAVIAPVGLLLADHQTKSEGPTGTPTATSSPSPVTTDPVTFRIDVSPPAEGTTGAEIPVPYWSDGELNTPTGTVIPIPQRLYDAVQDPTTGNWAGMTFDEADGSYAWTSFDESGVVETSYTLSDRVAVTPDGSSYAYLARLSPVGAPATWQVVRGGAEPRSWDLGEESPGDGSGVVGILGDGTVVVKVQATPETARVMLARPDGTIDLLPDGFLNVVASSAATDRIAVQTSANADGTSCWAVIDTSGKVGLGTCDYALDSFSADGRFVSAYASDMDNYPTAVSILDASTLQPVATFTMPRNGAIGLPMAWSGDTLVATVTYQNTWYVELLGLGGVRQVRSVAVRSDPFGQVPYQFGAGPLVPTR